MGARSPVLTLAELEQFDSTAPDRGAQERRFLCPLPACADKARDKAHRSLSVNTQSGAWRCWRCDAAGKLKEYWEERASERRPERARAKMRRRLEGEPPRPEPSPGENQDWRRELRGLVPLLGTEGARYLAARGIPLETAAAAHVKFHPSFYASERRRGRPACVFPVYSQAGDLVACLGRYTDGGENPKAQAAGPKALGVFPAAGAWESNPLILVEGPLDALALAAVGAPALALLGCELPEWLPRRCTRRRVLVATDADPAGDAAAARWAELLRSWGAAPERLRPEGAKDWAELLARDPAGLRAAVAAAGAAAGRKTSDSKPARLWDNEKVAAFISATYRRVGELVPDGALPWAEGCAPALAAAVNAADARLDAAAQAENLPALVEELSQLESAAALLAAAFAAREPAPELPW